MFAGEADLCSCSVALRGMDRVPFSTLFGLVPVASFVHGECDVFGVQNSVLARRDANKVVDVVVGCVVVFVVNVTAVCDGAVSGDPDRDVQ